MKNLGLGALQLEAGLDKYRVFHYQIIFKKFDETVSGEQLARQVAYQLSKNNDFMLLTNLGSDRVICLQQLSQHDIELDYLHVNLKELDPLDLDCGDEQHRQAIQRLINQDINQGAWKLKQANMGKLDYKKAIGGNTEIFEPFHSIRIQARSAYLEAFCSVQLSPEVLADGTVLIGLHLKHNLVAKPDISLQWVIDREPDWLTAINKVRHRYYEPGKAPAVAEFIEVVPDLNGSSVLPHLGKSLATYHREKGLLTADELAEAAVSTLIKVKYGQKVADHIASLVEPMFDFDTLSKIDSPLLNKLAKDLKWSLNDRIRTGANLVKGLHLPNFNVGLMQVDFGKLNRIQLPHKLALRFANGRKSGREQDVLIHKAFAGMTRNSVIPLIIGKQNDKPHNHRLLQMAYGALKQFANSDLPPLTKSPEAVESAAELDKRLHGKCPENAILLIGLTEGADKSAIRDTAFSYKLATQFMRLDHKPGIYTSHYFNNVAAGLFSKGGGQLCAIDDMPGDTDLFIGLDMGGVKVRAPGFAFLFLRSGAQLGWQLADKQQGEKMEDQALLSLLDKSLNTYMKNSGGVLPRRITLHRDGKFYESLAVIRQFEDKNGVKVDVLEVLKSGAPVLYRRRELENGKKAFLNPQVGDAIFLSEQEIILSTYSGQELGNVWGDKVSVRPLRLRKRYGDSSLSTPPYVRIVVVFFEIDNWGRNGHNYATLS
jgi:hypothetical protein